MYIYIALFFVIFLVTTKIKNEKWNIYDGICLTILILFSALRYRIGTDYNLYSSMFELGDNSVGRSGMLFALFMRAFQKLDLPFHLLIMIVSFFTNLIYYMFVKKYSKNPGLAILLYVGLGFYTTSFNMFRQMLSMMFILFALKIYDENKVFKAIIYSIIAILIHSSSIIAIIIYLIFKKLLKNNASYSIMCMTSVLILVAYDIVFYKVMPLFSQYQVYVKDMYLPGLGTKLNVIIYFVMLSLIAYYRYQLVQYNKDNNLFINIIMIGLVFLSLELKNYLFCRLAIYSTIFLPILLADLYKILDIRHKKLDCLCFYLCIFVYYLSYVYSFNEVVPYQCILFI